MTWVKLDDGFAEHPKIEQVGPLAGFLHVAALCYCARHLTDGRIPAPKARRLADIPAVQKRIDDLVDAGVWIPDGDDYVLHDYLDYQPSRSEVEADRAAARDRMAKVRATRQKRSSPERSAEQVANNDRSSEGGSQGSSGGRSATPTRPVLEEHPQPHAERGEPTVPQQPDHHGQHPNCRACGTNPRAQGTNQRGPKPPDPAESAIRAADAEMERNAARARGEGCPTCDGAMWLDTDRGPDGYPLPPEPCPQCNPEARTA